MKNQIYTVTIDGYSSEAYGVCRICGRAVFVPRALVGEKWRVRIVKVGASAVYGRGEELIERSDERIEPDCPYFGKCGGCDCRHMRYDEELRFKLDRVNSSLLRIGKQTLEAREIIGSDVLERYRNKGIFAVAEVGGEPACGFFRERTHELIGVGRCLLQTELAERAAKAVVSFMRENDLDAYDEKGGRGAVRHVFCRRAMKTADAVVCVVSAKGFGDKTASLAEALRKACPELSGIVLNINKQRGNTILAGEFYTLWGRPEIVDELCGSKFSIAPQAFFQINPPQAERLYRRALEYAGEGNLAFDLYCGAGTISLCLARVFRHVIGAEIVPEAVENAKENAAANGAENVEFLCADAGEAARALAERELKPDVIVVDPPRKGMDQAAIRAVASMGPERIVYVSCDPATLARDILRFEELGYRLREVTAVDMFPRTCHVETVCALSKLSEAKHHIEVKVDIRNDRELFYFRRYQQRSSAVDERKNDTVRRVMLQFGMPTLIENRTLQENVALCSALGLQFIELNMNYPEYQLTALEQTDALLEAAGRAGIYYTIHLDENLDIADFNPLVSKAYLETVRRTIEVAKRLLPLMDQFGDSAQPLILNIHMNHGIHITLPDRKVQMYERDFDTYMRSFTEFRSLCEDWIGSDNIRISIENTDGFREYEKKAIECLLESPVFTLTWDIGHSKAVHEKDVPFILKHQDRLEHFHVHDGTEAPPKNHLALGNGEIDLTDRLRLAERLGARCVLETKTAEALRQSASWLREHAIIFDWNSDL